MIAEIVTIGTELLLGEIVDTNAAYIARQLATIGIDHYYTTTVGDNEQRIAAVLQSALARSDVVITTGGLGPTVDDVTREAVARVCGRELVFHPELLAQIEAFFRKRGTTMSPNNRRQAYLPAGALAIENPVGTAPAFIVELDQKAIICLPGVPHEMTYLLQERVLPYLSQRMGEGAVILCRWLHTVGIGESAIDQAISGLMHSSNPTVGTRAHPGQTDVCITAKAKTHAEALQLLEHMEQQVRERLGAVVYGVDEETLGGVVVTALCQRRLTLALGETNTGGLVARRLLETEEGKQVLVGVRIALDGLRLAEDLGIQEPKANGEMACKLAGLLRERYAADLGLAILETDDETPLLCIALAAPDGVHLHRWPSRGCSDVAIVWTFHFALDVLRRWLMEKPA
ncbi:MAG: CinA family nicotinamide mononucleotide deamidase-related protein [Chloroflexi bacterium]|nr:CinA family nicotinamide mononucleotide deamidase-related protein [Chloroflexota bacterium]